MCIKVLGFGKIGNYFFAIAAKPATALRGHIAPFFWANKF
jgi:hypothetical protein